MPLPYTIWGIDGYAVHMIVVFIVGSLLFLIGVCLFPSKHVTGKSIVGFTKYVRKLSRMFTYLYHHRSCIEMPAFISMLRNFIFHNFGSI